ncbi:MAG: NADH-ubiquinone oxidoreductase-F iron-sulfur binding region domain-containing protein [Syntrophobacteraceae bacterium]
MRLRREAQNHMEARKEGCQTIISIGMATCGLAAGAEATRTAFLKELETAEIDAQVIPVGCIGHCYAEPFVVIHKPDFPPIAYPNVTPGKARVLVRNFLVEGDPVYEYVLGATEANELLPVLTDYPRFHLEERVVMDLCGKIDPANIHDYIAKGGYSGLFRAITLPPEDIIREVLESGLRGRGGAGFPTGLKWQYGRNGSSSGKTVICNADEGDPGAYMDRTLLESNPHQILEGLAICAVATGAEDAVIYVRAEYPLAVRMMSKAIQDAESLGIMGPSLLGTPQSFRVRLFQGSGAFVCGEETALIQSLEGRRGMPQHRPPYPVQVGLWGKPTVINNVKTLASIPPILHHGGKWYREIGSAISPGTAIFSVVGKVVHPGLVEIATGTTLRTLVFDICGGIPKQRSFKAVQIGGPSGGCLPEAFLDTPVDFDSLTKAGAMMGSGGMVVMDDESCMVNVARYFLEFTQKESCGKCTFCRIGTRHLLDTLDRITRGEGRDQDLDFLESLCADVRDGSLCGLGKTAPNPIITSLKYFRDEYEAHIHEKRCPALMCRPLVAFYIDLERCARGCDACVGSCPVDAIFTTKGRKKAIDQDKCVKCSECVAACPTEYDAVRKVSPPSLAPKVERPED